MNEPLPQLRRRQTCQVSATDDVGEIRCERLSVGVHDRRRLDARLDVPETSCLEAAAGCFGIGKFPGIAATP